MNVNRPNSVNQLLFEICASLLAASSALGQAPGVPAAKDVVPAESLCVHGGSNGALWLVRMDHVAQELALTPEQTRQFTLWADELNAETRRLLRGLRGGTGPEHEQRAAEKHRQAATVTEAFHRRVVERLDAQQRARLDELYIRFLKRRALFEPRIVARLALNASQQQALREALGSGENPPPYEKLLELLTDAQRQQLTAMQGRPFTFPEPHLIHVQPGDPRR